MEYDGTAWISGGVRLGDFLKHDALFEAYPQLKNAELRFEKLGDGTQGAYNRQENSITIDSSLRNAPEDTLIHEIQHAIQNAEGFTGGSSPEYWNTPGVAAIKPKYRAAIEAAQNEVKRVEQRFADEWGENSANLKAAERYVELTDQYLEQWDGAEPQTEAIEREIEQIDAAAEEGGWGDLLADYTSARAELDAKKAEAIRYRMDNYTAYRNTAGEIEARDVTKRRETAPDYGNEDTVFAEGVGISRDARYNEQTDEGGVSYGREMGDDNLRRRGNSENTGERNPQSAGGGGVSAQRGEEARLRLHGGRGRETVFSNDSEGQRLTTEQAQQLQGTAITDEAGAPLAVYHFTPEMEFETFEKGDIGFHFGTREQATQRGKDLKAENGRMFRAYLNIKNPYHVRLDLNAWHPSHIGLYLWSEGVLSDAEWAEIRGMEGTGYDSVPAQRLREILDGIGIDGFSYPNMVEGTGDSYIALRDDQIVRTDILPVKNKFSITEPVEQRTKISKETDEKYMAAVRGGDTETQQQMVDEATRSWGAMQNGYDGGWYFYHGTNSDEFTVFDKSAIGSANDSGFFGRGFYFAFTRGEAGYYGRNVKKAFLRITNPFNFQKELYTLNDIRSMHRPDIAFIINYAKKFPQLADRFEVEYVEKGNDEVKTMSYAEFSELFMKYYDSVDFKAEQLGDEDNEYVVADKYTETFEDYDGRKHTFTDYRFKQRVWGQDAANDRTMLTMEYLEKVVFDYVDTGTSAMNSVSSVIMDSSGFADELRKMGYDGVIQSESGDEAVVFDSEQIKSADPVTYDDNGSVIPLSERFNSKKRDIRFSISEDSEGRELTEEQAEYFSDSKVRDENGRLIPVYHGSQAQFTEFSADFMSMHGSIEGQGFYFTDSRDMAEGYTRDGGQLLEGYLNISNPLSDSEVTMTKAELRKLLKAIDPTGDDLVLNYDPYGGMDYPSKTWYNRALAAAVDQIYKTSDSDSEILADVANSGAGGRTNHKDGA